MATAQKRLFLAAIENGASEAETALATLPVALHRVPVSRIVRCADPCQRAEIANTLSAFRWILLTSANAATVFFDLVALPQSGSRPHVGCIGPNTADCVRRLGYTVDFVSPEHRGNAFAEAFVRVHESTPGRVLLPRPEKMASPLGERLARAGIEVTQMVLYRTEALPPESLADLDFNDSDLFAFLSPSGVRNFTRRYTIPQRATVFAIGPSTAAALAQLGYENLHTAEAYCRDGLLDTVRGFLDNGDQPEETVP